MRDDISQQRVQQLHPKVRQEVFDTIVKVEAGFPQNIKIRIVQGLRTPEEQDHLYALGRTLPGKIVTNAKAWKSNHNYGLSFDFALMYDRDGNGTYETLSWNTGEDFDGDKEADWMEVVKAFKEKGYSWGGDWVKFRDYPHIEKTFGLTVSKLYDKVVKKDFLQGTSYVNI